MEKINLKEKLNLFNEYWNPRIIGEVNESYVKSAKLKGDFVWHTHEKEDEMFYVLKGVGMDNCSFHKISRIVIHFIIINVLFQIRNIFRY